MATRLIKRMVMAATCAVAVAGAQSAHAQYYEMVNQVPALLSPALSGSFNYKGYVEASGIAGIGNNRVNIIGISTSQGFQYSSWFFMGAGIGIDVAMNNTDVPSPDYDRPGYWEHSSSTTKIMVPVFSDFRFNFGDTGSMSVFIDIKAGAMWLMGNSYLRLQHGCMTGDAQFYLKPSLGVRIPVNSRNPRQAVNIGLAYQLITSDNNYSYWNNNTLTLNGLGVSIAYEW